MKARNEDAVKAEWARKLTELKADIGDEYRATDDPDDETPAMQVTFGVTVGSDGNLSWSYQTGDNSFTGGAYRHPYWGTVTLARDSNVEELAGEAMEEVMEGIQVFGEEAEVKALEEGRWHSSGCGRIETRIPEAAIRDCSGPGRADDAVEYWSGKIERPESATPERLAACLKEFGAWDAEELADDAQNWRRWVWLACGDLAEEEEREA